ncbi:uncharacterized protein PG998_014309 [Apiospora kogelbergensis]|uniref:uncharacterized protein n=1 Tax=Apiospora kogelbergensis TaxID=1337665 RepID=UPI00312CF3EC
MTTLIQGISYKGLMLQRDALIERAVEAYDQSIDTKEYERSMGEIELKLSEQEYSLGSCLADAKIEDGSMPDGSKLQHPARMPWGAVE